MRVKNLGTRPAPNSIRDFVSHMVRGHAPSVSVPRRKMSYWQEHGWTRKGNQYSGSFQTPYGSFQGWIEEHRSGHADFYLYKPSQEIREHSHWTCFQHRGNDWYLVHMAKQPKDVSSGIIAIEKLISEAYSL